MVLLVIAVGALSLWLRASRSAAQDDVVRVARDHFHSTLGQAVRAAERMRLDATELAEREISNQPLSQQDIIVLGSNAAARGDTQTILVLELVSKALPLVDAEKQAPRSGPSSLWQVTKLSGSDAEVRLILNGKPALTYRLERINGNWKVAGD